MTTLPLARLQALEEHVEALKALVQSRKEERFVYDSMRPDTATELVRLPTACC